MKINYSIPQYNYYLPFVFLLSFFVESDFGKSFFYVPFRYILYLILLFFFFINLKYIDKWFVTIFVLLFSTSILGYIWSGQGIQILATNMLFILPFCLFSLNLFKNIRISSIYTFAIAFFILLLWSFAGFLNRWNDNVIAYLLYFGLVSIFFVTGKSNKNKTLVIFFYVASMIFVYSTYSRNVLLAMLIVAIIIFFSRLFKKRVVYRLTYLFSIVYSFVSMHFSFFILENEAIFHWLNYISQEYFGQSVFSGRIYLLQYGLELIGESTVSFLFGHGHLIYDLKFAPHNNYIALTYAYGIIGAILTAIMLIVVFEKAYKQILKGDNNSYVCFAILVGTFFQLGAESYLYGNDILVLMPYVYIAYIVNSDIKQRFYEVER